LSASDRLGRLENLLISVLRRLEVIEAVLKDLSGSGEAVSIAFKLVVSLSLPAATALRAAERVLSTVKSLGLADPIDRAVIEVLSSCDELTISEITRRVRVLRGSASRRVISSRVRKLMRRGVLVNLGSNSRPRITLRGCLRERGVEG